MKLRIASLTILCLVLTAVPAFADYSNGPINGTTDAWTINFGYVVSDSFVADTYLGINGFQFGVWEFPGDQLRQVEWSVTAGENSGLIFGQGIAGAGGGQLADNFISYNQYGYDIDLITVSQINVGLSQGTTYWLNLQNASVASGDPVYWDENSGQGCMSNGCPSSASQSSVGTIPSEAFTMNDSCFENCGTTPEPGGFWLFGSGILGLAGVLRRRVF